MRGSRGLAAGGEPRRFWCGPGAASRAMVDQRQGYSDLERLVYDAGPRVSADTQKAVVGGIIAAFGGDEPSVKEDGTVMPHGPITTVT